MIHAKRFKFHVFYPPPELLEFLETKDEVEQLDLVIMAVLGSRAELVWVMTSVTNHITIPCPNMKVLRLQFRDVRGADRELVSQLCRKMMNKRRLAGYFLEKCYIWWHQDDWEKDAPFVLVMENEVVRVSS